VGVVSLIAFVLWETFANLKEPLVPMYVFDNRGWVCSTLISGVGASMYYAFGTFTIVYAPCHYVMFTWRRHHVLYPVLECSAKLSCRLQEALIVFMVVLKTCSNDNI
jgi:hypothetical protein